MATTYDNLPEQIDFLISEILVIKEILLNKDKKNEVTPRYLHLEKALSLLNERGYIMSKSKLYKLTSSNAIPNQKVGNKLVFCLEELEQWINNQINNKERTNIDSNFSIIRSAQQKLSTF